MRAGGPTRIGAISPSRAASTIPSMEIRSQGCATAVVTGGSCRAARKSRSYRACGSLAFVFMVPLNLCCLFPADRGWRTREDCLDACETTVTFLGQCTARSKHATHHGERLLAVPAILWQQLRKRGDRPLRI